MSSCCKKPKIESKSDAKKGKALKKTSKKGQKGIQLAQESESEESSEGEHDSDVDIDGNDSKEGANLMSNIKVITVKSTPEMQARTKQMMVQQKAEPGTTANKPKQMPHKKMEVVNTQLPRHKIEAYLKNTRGSGSESDDSQAQKKNSFQAVFESVIAKQVDVKKSPKKRSNVRKSMDEKGDHVKTVVVSEPDIKRRKSNEGSVVSVENGSFQIQNKALEHSEMFMNKSPGSWTEIKPENLNQKSVKYLGTKISPTVKSETQVKYESENPLPELTGAIESTIPMELAEKHKDLGQELIQLTHDIISQQSGKQRFGEMASNVLKPLGTSLGQQDKSQLAGAPEFGKNAPSNCLTFGQLAQQASSGKYKPGVGGSDMNLQSTINRLSTVLNSKAPVQNPSCTAIVFPATSERLPPEENLSVDVTGAAVPAPTQMSPRTMRSPARVVKQDAKSPPGRPRQIMVSPTREAVKSPNTQPRQGTSNPEVGIVKIQSPKGTQSIVHVQSSVPQTNLKKPPDIVQQAPTSTFMPSAVSIPSTLSTPLSLNMSPNVVQTVSASPQVTPTSFKSPPNIIQNTQPSPSVSSIPGSPPKLSPAVTPTLGLTSDANLHQQAATKPPPIAPNVGVIQVNQNYMRAASVVQSNPSISKVGTNPGISAFTPVTLKRENQSVINTNAGSITNTLPVNTGNQLVQNNQLVNNVNQVNMGTTVNLGTAVNPVNFGTAVNPVNVGTAVNPVNVGAPVNVGTAVNPVNVRMAVNPVNIGATVSQMNVATAVNPVNIGTRVINANFNQINTNVAGNVNQINTNVAGNVNQINTNVAGNVNQINTNIVGWRGGNVANTGINVMNNLNNSAVNVVNLNNMNNQSSVIQATPVYTMDQVVNPQTVQMISSNQGLNQTVNSGMLIGQPPALPLHAQAAQHLTQQSGNVLNRLSSPPQVVTLANQNQNFLGQVPVALTLQGSSTTQVVHQNSMAGGQQALSNTGQSMQQRVIVSGNQTFLVNLPVTGSHITTTTSTGNVVMPTSTAVTASLPQGKTQQVVGQFLIQDPKTKSYKLVSQVINPNVAKSASQVASPQTLKVGSKPVTLVPVQAGSGKYKVLANAEGGQKVMSITGGRAPSVSELLKASAKQNSAAGTVLATSTGQGSPAVKLIAKPVHTNVPVSIQNNVGTVNTQNVGVIQSKVQPGIINVSSAPVNLGAQSAVKMEPIELKAAIQSGVKTEPIVPKSSSYINNQIGKLNPLNVDIKLDFGQKVPGAMISPPKVLSPNKPLQLVPQPIVPISQTFSNSYTSTLPTTTDDQPIHNYAMPAQLFEEDSNDAKPPYLEMEAPTLEMEAPLLKFENQLNVKNEPEVKTEPDVLSISVASNMSETDAFSKYTPMLPSDGSQTLVQTTSYSSFVGTGQTKPKRKRQKSGARDTQDPTEQKVPKVN